MCADPLTVRVNADEELMLEVVGSITAVVPAWLRAVVEEPTESTWIVYVPGPALEETAALTAELSAVADKAP